MALILKYRLEPPESLNQEVYQALAHQVGRVGINLQLPLHEDDPEKAVLILKGEFVSVEGEHFEASRGSLTDDRTLEERREGPSSDAANRAASEDGPMFPMPGMDELWP